MDAFARFQRDRGKDLRRIASATRGEHSLDDVWQEAWLIADQVAHRTGRAKDFDDPDFQSLLIAFLYQALVRYTELNVRLAVPLDHAPAGNDDDGQSHPLFGKLTGDQGRDPLSYLLAVETGDKDEAPSDAALLGTNAGAWVVLLRQCDNRMRTVSGRLLISLPHAYHCMARARERATFQAAIPLRSRERAPRLGAWRRARYERIPQQLAFDFDPALDFQPPP